MASQERSSAQAQVRNLGEPGWAGEVVGKSVRSCSRPQPTRGDSGHRGRVMPTSSAVPKAAPGTVGVLSTRTTVPVWGASIIRPSAT